MLITSLANGLCTGAHSVSDTEMYTLSFSCEMETNYKTVVN